MQNLLRFCYLRVFKDDYLKERRQMLGEERIRQEAEWQELIAQVHTMEKGTDPMSEPAQVLAQQWLDLIGEFTGGNAGLNSRCDVPTRKTGSCEWGTVVEPEASAMWEFMGKRSYN